MPISDGTLKELIRKKELVITPFEEENVEPASIDLRLGDGFLIVDHNLMKNLSLDQPIEYRKFEGEKIILPPHHFLLATTLERIKLPSNISGKVEGRSSIGRRGLFIQNAGWIDPGFEGNITLELYNANELPLEIHAGRRICQIVLDYTDRPVERPYGGKYKGQIGTVGSLAHKDRELSLNKKIIGVTGTLASGKGAVVEILKERGFKHYSARSLLIEEIDRRGMDRNRDNMLIIANEWRREKGQSYIAEELYLRAKEDNVNVVIESLRHPAEVLALKSRGNFLLLSVDADPKIRYSRMTERNNETDSVSYEKFLYNERREMTANNSHDANIMGCIKMADYILENNKDLDILRENILKILGENDSANKKRKIDLTACACIVYDSKVLLMHHVKLDKWLFPGGHIETNETPDEALVREVREEAMLEIEFLHFSKIAQQPEEIKKLAIPFHTNLHSVGDHDHYGSYYLCTVNDPNFVKNNESKEMKWFSATEIASLEKIPLNVKQMATYAINSIDISRQKPL